jgi:hypothetical protein
LSIIWRTFSIAADAPISCPAEAPAVPVVFRASPRCRGSVERRFDQAAQLIQGDRLGQVVEGARLERGDGVLGTAEGRDHRYRRLTVTLANQAHDLQAVAIGQPHVGDAQADSAAFQDTVAPRRRVPAQSADKPIRATVRSRSSRMSASSSTTSTRRQLAARAALRLDY